jgi:hypothetical protein
LGMAGRAERHQAVEVEVRAPLGALDDVVDFEGAPAATGLVPPAGAEESTVPLQRRTDAQRVRYNRAVGRQSTAMLRSLLLHERSMSGGEGP